MKRHVTIISLADSKYYNMLKYLVMSAAKYFPEAKMYVSLVNMSPKWGNKLKKIHPKLEYRIENVKFNCDAQKMCFCTNRRADLFYNLRISRPNDVLIWIDADCIIRKDCSDFFKFITANDYDISVRWDNVPKYPSKPPTMIKKNKKVKGFLAGVMVINSSQKGTKFIQEYRKVVSQKSYLYIDSKTKNVKQDRKVFGIWMSNQRQIYGIYRNNRDIKLKPLLERFCDTWFYDNSTIWAAIWNNKYDKRFMDEYQKIKE